MEHATEPAQTPLMEYDGELEGIRTREFYKYYEPFDNLMKTTNERVNSGTAGRTSSFDDTLAAFAQFITMRLGARRVLVSCFDRHHQYVLAEGTPSLSLQTHKADDQRDDLWLGSGLQERNSLLCERTLELAEQKQRQGHDGVFFIADVTKDEWFQSRRRHIKTPPNLRSYAGTAIRSPLGPVIGVISVLDDRPRDSLSDSDRHFLRHMADTIMSHLDMVRSKEEHRRTSQMVIGLGSFVEGKDMPDETLHPSQVASSRAIEHQKLPPDASTTSTARPPEIEHIQSPSPEPQSPEHSQPGSREASIEHLQTQMLSTNVKSTFTRAARIIKNVIDVEGVIFLDASVGSYGGLVQSVPLHSDDKDDTRSYFARNSSSAKSCPVLGCAGIADPGLLLTEGFLHGLLTRYKQGRIFNFDPNEDDLETTNKDSPGQTEDFRQRVEPEEEQDSDSETRERVRQQRQADIEELQRLFPEARSLAFVPTWDDHRLSWFSGGFIWSTRPIRLLHKDSELSFLRAFGITIMSEVAKLDTAFADKAKSDLLNSISHELRSPLHGILGSIECLEATRLDSLQQSLAETADTCGRTLLGTIEHLLDFSKINNFTRNKSKRQKISEEVRHADQLSLESQVHLAAITEEALETVFAGSSTFDAPRPRSRTNQQSQDPETRNQNVQLVVDIEAKEFEDWLFNAEGGAWRRLVMNLAGNSLKYTSSGSILIRLAAQELPRDSEGLKRSRITFTVKDTGKGISKNYLRNHLFRPFAQENPLNPGAGLGLSLVQQIVNNMGGEIFIESEVGKGTEVRVEAILSNPCSSTDSKDAAFVMTEAARKLDGLKAAYIGPFDDRDEQSAQKAFQDALGKQCKSWFHMDFASVDGMGDVDDVAIVIATARRLPEIKDQLISLQKPVVVLCANASTIRQAYGEATSLRRAVATDFITQPFGPRKLARALITCKEGHGAGQEMENVVLYRDTELATGEDVPQAEQSVEPEPVAARVTRSQSKEITTVGKKQAGSKADAEQGGNADKYKPLRLLLVDDNQINLQLLVRYCKSKKHDYITAEDGIEAVEAFSSAQSSPSTHIDFVCMDISMPRMDGLEATRRIRQFEAEKKMEACKVIALTGLASAEAQQEAFSSGVDQFLTKPVRLKELGDVLAGER